MGGGHHGHSHGPPTGPQHPHNNPNNTNNGNSSYYEQQNFTPGAKWIKDLTKNRLGTFEGGHFSDVNLSSVMYDQRVDDEKLIQLEVWSAPGREKPTFEEAMAKDKEYKKAKKGDRFGPSWTNHWWKVTVHIPDDWKKYDTVQFEFDPGCEAMIYTTDGVPLQGITGGYGGDRRVEYIIPHDIRKKGTHHFVIESSCNGMFGVPWDGDTISPPDMNRYFNLASADLVVPNTAAWGLHWDFQTLRELADSLPGNSPLQNKAIVTANKIMNTFDKTKPEESIKEARKIAEEVFGDGWEGLRDKVYKEGWEKGDTRIWGIGHCHIDTAWLWPYRVTQQKVARSWSTQVDLMERYPEHRFTASSAQQYKWLEQLYPPLFERVKEKIVSGQFHLVGGSWVENDANMPSGEALARQMIFGQRFFESRFGIRCETAWLPDSFGLTGALPQLIRLAGMDHFFTQKLSWNNINVFPHSTFNWVGIDGTQVLCHMTPVDTYTAQATVGDVQKGIQNHKNLESNAQSLLVFGNGDGGGGPLNKMLENLRRIRGAANEFRELPPVNMGHSVEDFFEALKEESDGGRALPNWHGELYLEFHRGTYTSHSPIKKGNRKSEILMRDVEHVATLASVFKAKEYGYPKKAIDDNWEKLLLNQFHDVLPGSAIGMVYDDAEAIFSEIRKSGDALFEDAISILMPSSSPLSSLSDNIYSTTSPTPTSALTSANGGADLVGLNTTFFPRRDIVKIPKEALGALKGVGREYEAQELSDGSGAYVVMDGREGQGVATPIAKNDVALVDGPGFAPGVSVQTSGEGYFVLKSSSMQMTVAEGRITSLFDIHHMRELIPAGQTGGLVMFQDRPNYWDAWDVEIHHLEKRTELKFASAQVVAEGPLRASIETQVKYGNSTINVTISLDAITATLKSGSRPLFTFSADVDWHERHEFLKFEIPLNIHSDVATYETPFGYVQRPTHKNTTWDAAKFEVCGHKYADLSEFGYGVAILSESKYGFSCQGNVLRISLLRSATAPDAEQDQGQHEFSWAVMAHQGHFLESDVPIAAFLFNSPIHLRAVGPSESQSASLVPVAPFTLSGAKNVFLETIKRGDLDSDLESDYHRTSKDKSADGKRSIVLRLYEAYGGHASVELAVSDTLEIVGAYETNLLEDDYGAKALEMKALSKGEEGEGKSVVKLEFRGFEVKTVKLVLKGSGSGLTTKGVTVQGGKPEHGRKDSWVQVQKAEVEVDDEGKNTEGL